MKFEEFKALTANYQQAIGKGKPAHNSQGQPVTNQTKSIWFDRKTLEKLLSMTDQDKGGIKMFFAQYDPNTQPSEEEDYSGQLTLILAASNSNEDPREEEQLINGGELCPPKC